MSASSRFVRGYRTYAELMARKSFVSDESVVFVTDDPVPEKNGQYLRRDGTFIRFDTLSSETLVNQSVRQLYVDGAAGSDTNDGLSAAQPKKSLQAAVDAAGIFQRTGGGLSTAPHVTINVAAGELMENVTISGLVSVGPATGNIGLQILGAAETEVLPAFTVTEVNQQDPDDTLGRKSAQNTYNGGSWTVTCAGAGWAANAYAGDFVYGVSGTGAGVYAVIVGNTADTLEICRDSSYRFTAGSVLKIVRPSTTITGTITVRGAQSIVRLVNLNLKQPAGGTTRPVVYPNGHANPGNSPGVQVSRCRYLANQSTGGLTNIGGISFDSCYLDLHGGTSTYLFASSAAGLFASLQRSYAKNAGRLYINSVRYTLQFSVIDLPISTVSNFIGEYTNINQCKVRNLGGQLNFNGAFNTTFTNSLVLKHPTGYGKAVVTYNSTGVTLGSLTLINFPVPVEVNTCSNISCQYGLYFLNCGSVLLDRGSVFASQDELYFKDPPVNAWAVSVIGGATFNSIGLITFVNGQNGLQCREGSTLAHRAGIEGNVSGVLLSATAGGFLSVYNTPLITGQSKQAIVDNVDKTWADLPVLGAAGSAMVYYF
jgi:hypothetical protein